MEPFHIGMYCIFLLIALICLRVHISFSTILAGIVGITAMLGLKGALGYVVADLYTQFNNYGFSAVPMFVLMGYFAATAGMTERLFSVAYAWVGWIRGGLAVATVAACALFAAVSGSGPATAATIGKVAFPQMKKYGYDDRLSTACIAAAGTLGPLIPPSGAMIIYAILAGQSIIKCLVAGILPGVLITFLMAIQVYWQCARDPKMGPAGPKTTWNEKFKALPNLAEPFVLFVFAIGGLYAGFFTPTQAGAAGAMGCLVIAVLFRRGITFKAIWKSSHDAVGMSCMVLMLIAGSVIFGHLLTLSTFTPTFVDWVQNLPVNRYVIIAGIMIFYVIGGCFLDSLGLLVLSTPLIIPVIAGLGFDLIWWGVIMCMLGEVGAITPPLGVNVFVIRFIADVPLGTVFKGILPFFFTILLGIIIVTIFPIIATFIPSMVG